MSTLSQDSRATSAPAPTPYRRGYLDGDRPGDADELFDSDYYYAASESARTEYDNGFTDARAERQAVSDLYESEMQSWMDAPEHD